MTKKKCGALPKFGKLPTKVLRINRVVTLKEHDLIREKTNELINQLQSEALTKCAEEALKSK